MSKNKGGDGFQNMAAKRFKDPDKIALMSQQDIYSIFEEDISTMLEQVTAARNHRGRYPQYVANAFANLSTALWFKEYAEAHSKKSGTKTGKLKTDLTEDEVESTLTLIADGYKKSATSQYPKQTSEFEDRNKLLGEAFARLYPRVYRLTGKLLGKDGKSKREKNQILSQRRDLTIQVYGDPINNFKFIHKTFNNSTLSDKKKLKLLHEMYGKRFKEACGAALTVDSNNSDCIAMIYDYVAGLKTKKRAPIVMAYAIAYKKNQSSNMRLSDGKFYKKNKRLIKELRNGDIGFKKAFKNLKQNAKKEQKFAAKRESTKPTDSVPWKGKR